MSDWITLPSPPVLHPSTPLLIRSGDVDGLRHVLGEQGVGLVEVDVSEAASPAEVIAALKDVLPFPSWCGSSWDSLDDAFAELQDCWSFPLVIVAYGLPSLLGEKPHLALESVIRLHELSGAFSTAGDQFVVVFAAGSWP